MADEIAAKLRLYSSTYPLFADYQDDDVVVDSPSTTPYDYPEDATWEDKRARERRNCLYIPELDSGVDFQTWLKHYRPSQIRSSDYDVNRIALMGKPEVHDFLPVDEEKIKSEWDALFASGRPITPAVLEGFAKNLQVLSGKWMFYPTTDEVDADWDRVATAAERGDFGPKCMGVKVTTFQPGGRRHTAFVYNKDFTDFEEVQQMEKAIRSAGIHCHLRYKADIYTFLGIYGLNAADYCLSSHLYCSDYDEETEKSTVISTSEIKKQDS